MRLTDLDWTFVTTGLSDAVTAARERTVTPTPTATHLTYDVL